MSEPSPGTFRLSEADDANISQYHALSSLAVAGLVLAVLGPLAMLGPAFWVIPLAAVVASGAAMWRIVHNDPVLTGWKLAQIGLLLGIVLSVAAPVDWAVHRRMIRREARDFARLWFDALADDAPEKAYQLAVHPKLRQPLDNSLWDWYRHNQRWRLQLEKYVEAPLVRTLLALKTKAEVRYYYCAAQTTGEDGETVDLVYAVNYEDAEGQRTFFCNLGLERLHVDDGRVNWRLVHAEAGFRPPGW
jgi:hypothetical protein